MASFLKVVLGGALVGYILYAFPVVEILKLFFLIVVIPILLMVGLGLISEGTYNAFAGGWNGWLRDLKAKQAAYAAEFRMNQ